MAPRARSILLVDDDVDIRECLAEALEAEGYAVHAAQNGREALDWLRQSADLPYAILLDMMMPVMDGKAFLGARDASPLLSNIPVVVITAGSGCSELQQAHDVSACFSKPITLEGLLATLEQCA